MNRYRTLSPEVKFLLNKDMTISARILTSIRRLRKREAIAKRLVSGQSAEHVCHFLIKKTVVSVGRGVAFLVILHRKPFRQSPTLSEFERAFLRARGRS